MMLTHSRIPLALAVFPLLAVLILASSCRTTPPYAARSESELPSQKVTTFLWFDGQAEQAAHFYASVFEDASVLDPIRTPEQIASGPPALMVTFEIAGQRFLALNGGPQFHFTEAISLLVLCEDQAEVDRYWNRLTEAGEAGQCGWLKDRYGLSWQIIPKALPELMGDPDPAKAGRVAQAMMGMTKIDVRELRAAHAGQ